MIELNKIVQVRSISIVPINIVTVVFKEETDLKNFLINMQNCENAINNIAHERNRNLGAICRILKYYAKKIGIWPDTMMPNSKYKDFVELIQNSSNSAEIYKYICNDLHVIEFEFCNPIHTEIGWELQNFTIWFNTFEYKEKNEGERLWK